MGFFRFISKIGKEANQRKIETIYHPDSNPAGIMRVEQGILETWRIVTDL